MYLRLSYEQIGWVVLTEQNRSPFYHIFLFIGVMVNGVLDLVGYTFVLNGGLVEDSRYDQQPNIQ